MPDYTFYVEDYLGEDIPEKEFPRFIRRAGDELRRMREMYAVAPRQGLDPELTTNIAENSCIRNDAAAASLNKKYQEV